MEFNFNNKTVVVTGASKGIGKTIAISFAKLGANVVLLSRSKIDLNTVQKIIKKNGGASICIPTDVSDFDNFQSSINTAMDEFKEINILINNAGITKDNLLLRLKPADWDTVMDINLKGCFNGIKSVAKHMIKKRFGKIINISSIVGITGNAGQSNYSASKAGIIGLTKSAAKELASRNITVNAVAPGYIETEMTSSLTDEYQKIL